MTAFVDTNILVRHPTGDPPEMAARASHFLATSEDLHVVGAVIAEVVHVLESFYEVERQQVAQAIRSIVAFPSTRVADLGIILRAVDLYETDRLDFADGWVVAAGERAAVRSVASLDRGLDRAPTIDRIEPG